jgi:hypothetical protein
MCKILQMQNLIVIQNQWACLKRQLGITFGVVRIYQREGKVDPNGIQTLKNGHAGGLKFMDANIVPCKNCKNPSAKQQMKDALEALKKGKIKTDLVSCFF